MSNFIVENINVFTVNNYEVIYKHWLKWSGKNLQTLPQFRLFLSQAKPLWYPFAVLFGIAQAFLLKTTFSVNFFWIFSVQILAFIWLHIFFMTNCMEKIKKIFRLIGLKQGLVNRLKYHHDKLYRYKSCVTQLSEPSNMSARL